MAGPGPGAQRLAGLVRRGGAPVARLLAQRPDDRHLLRRRRAGAEGGGGPSGGVGGASASAGGGVQSGCWARCRAASPRSRSARSCSSRSSCSCRSRSAPGVVLALLLLALLAFGPLLVGARLLDEGLFELGLFGLRLRKRGSEVGRRMRYVRRLGGRLLGIVRPDRLAEPQPAALGQRVAAVGQGRSGLARIARLQTGHGPRAAGRGAVVGLLGRGRRGRRGGRRVRRRRIELRRRRRLVRSAGARSCAGWRVPPGTGLPASVAPPRPADRPGSAPTARTGTAAVGEAGQPGPGLPAHRRSRRWRGSAGRAR